MSGQPGERVCDQHVEELLGELHELRGACFRYILSHVLEESIELESTPVVNAKEQAKTHGRR